MSANHVHPFAHPQPAAAAAATVRPTPSRRAALRFAAGLAALCALSLAARPAVAQVRHGSAIERPRSLRELLERSRRNAHPVVALFSTRGCGWCDAIRREQLAALAREQASHGVLVVEFDLLDDREFDDVPVSGGANDRQPFARSRSPAALSRALGVRIAPTLVFLGVDGELAERLVGYTTPDFYSAYLDERIAKARASLASARHGG